MADLPDKPITRAEQYLANIAGQSVELPEKPLSRIEQYLDYIAKNGSAGGGGSSGVSSFNRRAGAVMPQPGDYTAEQVGAIDISEKGAAGGVATLDATGKILSSQIPELNIYDIIDATGSPEAHRCIFRGKYLGDHVTETQLAAIQDGTFKGLFVGDYWIIDSVTWRIADMDYFLRCGDTEFDEHHLVIVPDKSLYSAKMNDTNTTDGGYTNSAMYKMNLAAAKATINAAFPGLVLTHRDFLITATSNGIPAGGAWFESTIELMTEIMVYGTKIYATKGGETNTTGNTTISKQQFALFVLNPKMVNTRENYWLRDVASAADFSSFSGGGFAYRIPAQTSQGVRPYFCIGKANSVNLRPAESFKEGKING